MKSLKKDTHIPRNNKGLGALLVQGYKRMSHAVFLYHVGPPLAGWVANVALQPTALPADAGKALSVGFARSSGS